MGHEYVYIGIGIAVVIIGSLLIFFVFGNGVLSGTVWTHRGIAQSNGFLADYELDVYSNDGHTIVGKIHTDAHGHYSIQLPAGNYIIYIKDHIADPVKVVAGQNITFDILTG